MSDWKQKVYQSYVSSGHVPDSGKSAEDHLRGRSAFFKGIIRRHFPPGRESRILDIGCGHGALLYFLHKAGYRNIRGVDGSREQVEFSRRLGIPGVELGEISVFLSTCDEASAEVICLFDILEHFTRQEAFDLLTQVRRVLCSDGVCIGHVPNGEGIFGMGVRFGDLTHEQAFTASSINQMLKAMGFGVVQCFEDKPEVHGSISAARRVLWDVGTAPSRLLFAAETGTPSVILSRNLLFVARR
jgi:2-polyprenyl-3-methyl-5-hydroxy-6-metoxy-1,4-benzoquinol methylase